MDQGQLGSPEGVSVSPPEIGSSESTTTTVEAPLSPGTANALAALCHALAVASPVLLPAAVVVGILMLAGRRSTFLRFQASQALVYHLLSAMTTWVVIAVVGGLGPFGLCLVPLAAILVLLMALYPLWAAWQCLLGRNFKYIGIGTYVKASLDRGAWL